MDYLTRAEQMLLERLPRGSFTVEQVPRMESKRYGAQLLSRLVRKKRLVRLEKGLFFFGDSRDSRRYSMAISLAPGGYIGFVSALSYHGWVDEQLSRVQVCTRKKRGMKDLGGFDVQFVPMGDADFYGIADEGALRVSTKAKTFFDCLKKPAMAGGIDKVIRTLKLAELGLDDWTELAVYLDATPSKSLKQRSGFWLDGLAPEWFLMDLEKSIGRKSVVRMPNCNPIQFDARWGVYHGPIA
ncbi:hypothetical protein HY994_00510 [Candidatus Micrarchaeota archaeon]|nr:hypothetical protein [Candidatus Micrarchaeota archaeon]